MASVKDKYSVQLAIQASECLRRVIYDLLRETQCVQFCASLLASIHNVTEWLRVLPEDKCSDKKVASLLNRLEDMCQLNKSLAQDSPELLARTTETNVEDISTLYPALRKLLTDIGDAVAAIRILACDKRGAIRRKMILEDMEQFSSQTLHTDDTSSSTSDVDLQLDMEGPRDIREDILTLYKALFTDRLCIESEKVVACLRLHDRVHSDGKLTFGVIFMAHPHDNRLGIEPQPFWHDAHFSVGRSVKFQDNAEDENQEIICGPDNPFCGYISAQESFGAEPTYFLVQDQKLYFNRYLDHGERLAPQRPTISLCQLLEEVRASNETLDEKRKEVLSWLLARAFWQYYSSPWMPSPWSKENIHFIFEHKAGYQNDGIFVNDPLLSVSIVPTIQDINEPGSQHKISFGMHHKLPEILALGVMLIEIQLERSMENLYHESRWSKYLMNGKPNLNTNFKICSDLIKEEGFYSDISNPLESLIRSCINPKKVFMPYAGNVSGIRDALYKLISRLETYLSERKPEFIKPLCVSGHVSTSQPLPPAPPPPPQLQASLARPLPTPPRESCPQRGRTMASISSSTSTKEWFEQMDGLKYILDSTANHEKVKIAIIDTGVDPNDPAAYYVAGYRDFVNGEHDVKRDETGHGTDSINLVFEMYPQAKVFALRVFETNEANEQTAKLAIEAVAWCIKEEMDVICMACGFDQYNHGLWDMIQQASGKMLIFAAPTNKSNAGEIAYPARHSDLVFCMFSTNGAVTRSQHLNPTIGPSLHNFAILGENIMTISGEEKSGTSFSTAIAAGLAGRLLEFSRHEDCKDRLPEACRMKVKEGMTKILLAMAKTDGKFHCLKPWVLLPTELANRLPFRENGPPTEAEKKEAREHICDVIRFSLKDTWTLRLN